MRSPVPLAAIAAVCLSSAIHAEDDFCVDRPGLATPPCVLARQEAVAELGAAAWENDRDASGSSDTVTLAELTLRLGLGNGTEVQLSLPAHGVVRQHDDHGRLVDRVAGFGDTTLALRHGFKGKAAAYALMGYVTLPTGHDGIGAGDWGAGLLVPIEIDLPADFTLGLTPHGEAAVNQRGKGRHFAWGGVAGLSHAIAPGISLTAELAADRDLDPAGHQTMSTSALSLAWQPHSGWQLDVQANFGLNHAAPRRTVMLGMARRF